MFEIKKKIMILMAEIFISAIYQKYVCQVKCATEVVTHKLKVLMGITQTPTAPDHWETRAHWRADQQQYMSAQLN